MTHTINNPTSPQSPHLFPKMHFVYFLSFLCFLFIFDRSLFYFIHTTEQAHYKKKDFKRLFNNKRNFNKHFVSLPKGTYDTLIMGSSRTHRGIHPFYIKKELNHNAFKIANANLRIKFNYFFYKEYKKYGGTPKILIYGLDYFMFRIDSEPFFLQFVTDTKNNKKKITNGPLLLFSNKPSIDAFFNTTLDNWMKNFSNPQPILNLKTFNPIDPFTGFPQPHPISEIKPNTFKTYPYEGYPGIEGQYFPLLLKELAKDNVQVILVYLPEYIGTYESNHQHTQFHKDIQKLTAPYPNITIYDYNDPKKFDLSNGSYFLDGGYGKSNSHLSRQGAAIFNRLFIRDLKKHYGTGSRARFSMQNPF